MIHMSFHLMWLNFSWSCKTLYLNNEEGSLQMCEGATAQNIYQDHLYLRQKQMHEFEYFYLV